MKYLFLFLVILMVGCVSEKQIPKHNDTWAFIDGIRVDRIDTFYDYATQKKRVAALVGNDTIWEHDYVRVFQLTDTAIIYTDKNGTHKF